MYSSLVRHIRRFPDGHWDWQVLSLNPCVTLDALKTFHDKPWNWTLLMQNKNWNWNWVREFPEKPWNWKFLSESEYFRWDWVREFPKKAWNWNILSDRIENVDTIHNFPDAPWNWTKLTLGNNTTISDIMKFPNYPWTISELMFTAVDEEIIQFIRFYRSHYDIEAWCDHTAHTPWKLIRSNLDLPWVFRFVKIQDTKDFTEADVDTLYRYSHSWDWDHMSEMLDFESIISKHPDLPWSHDYISKNRSVSYKHVMQFSNITWNLNTIQLEDEKKEWIAAEVIKRYWKRSVTDPKYKLCQKIVINDLTGALQEHNREDVHGTNQVQETLHSGLNGNL